MTNWINPLFSSNPWAISMKKCLENNFQEKHVTNGNTILWQEILVHSFFSEIFLQIFSAVRSWRKWQSQRSCSMRMGEPVWHDAMLTPACSALCWLDGATKILGRKWNLVGHMVTSARLRILWSSLTSAIALRFVRSVHWAQDKACSCEFRVSHIILLCSLPEVFFMVWLFDSSNTQFLVL